MKWLDAFMDRFTMYRLLLYYLILLLFAAIILSAFGLIHYQPLDILFCSLLLTATCWLSNKLFAFVFEAPTNVESPLITALILALIISPSHNSSGFIFMIAAGGLAMASKYILAVKKRHIFNPAAIAVALTSFGAGDAASWWVGTVWMLPFVLVGGILLTRRIRRSKMVVWFALTAIIATAALAILNGTNAYTAAQKEILNSALFFMAFVMLTEPLTSPTTKTKQSWYAIIIGLLFPPQIQLAGIYSTPELTLLIGNVFSYLIGPRVKTYLHLKERVRLSPDSIDFIFTPEDKFSYKAGQFVELTLQHPETDSRGARRYFTLASSPTEQDVQFGIKFYKPGSSFKRALLELKNETPIIAAQVGGDFILPEDSKQKIVFIAGGIGVTPFRSMIKYLIDTKQSRPITLLYSAKNQADLVYREVFEQASTQLGINVFYFVDGNTAMPPVHNGRLNESVIKKVVPDIEDSLFYISGPHGMVVATEEQLRNLGVAESHIKKDFFSGYA
ncbi:MAG TPA: RnfABCDGE type electron transport complex subunit D [Patescibacteria group bacterium]|jgi:ferredoxin-NADP reductase/Na+-translocating ferredoxin:NAD+ oxidoreductase RnfD subunit|nr:RnfABCDGE type electron transport complex subunit D [Patescibacteria group bacterium]